MKMSHVKENSQSDCFSEPILSLGAKGLSPLARKVVVAIERFCGWLKSYGEESQDLYDFWAIPYGQSSKSIYYKNKAVGVFLVAPFLLLEDLLSFIKKILLSKIQIPHSRRSLCHGFCLSL